MYGRCLKEKQMEITERMDVEYDAQRLARHSEDKLQKFGITKEDASSLVREGADVILATVNKYYKLEDFGEDEYTVAAMFTLLPLIKKAYPNMTEYTSHMNDRLFVDHVRSNGPAELFGVDFLVFSRYLTDSYERRNRKLYELICRAWRLGKI